MDIPPVSATTPLYKPPPAAPADSAFTFAPAVLPSAESVKSAEAVSDTKAEHENIVRRAALSFSNTYAVSDTSFTIFKDSEGKYITRYTSLRDGTVTYVPEAALVKHLQSLSAPSNIVSLEA